MVELEYRNRTLEKVLEKAIEQFPAVIVTGPRQSGKTTMVRHLLAERYNYCTLDDPMLRVQATTDPLLLLERHPPPLILDEIQYAPGLLHYVKMIIDENRHRRGMFVLTGSQVFSLMQGVDESLAGRAAVLSLHSFSLREVLEGPDSDTDWRSMLLEGPIRRPASVDRLADALFRGGFPEPALRRDINVGMWQSSYLSTYLERDVRSLRAVGDLGDFQRFLLLLAARCGQLLNFADMARDLGVSAKTVRAWLSVLEASGHVYLLRPYHRNKGKRLVKRPKAYFLDTGVLCHLLGFDSSKQAMDGAFAGMVFEAAVFGQLFRLFAHRGEIPRLYFWRTASGHEVDFVVERGGRLLAIEARLTATPSPRDAAGIEGFMRLFGNEVERGLVVCLAPERHPLVRGVDAVPLGCF